MGAVEILMPLALTVTLGISAIVMVRKRTLPVAAGIAFWLLSLGVAVFMWVVSAKVWSGSLL